MFVCTAELRKQLYLGAPVMFVDQRINTLVPGWVVVLRQNDVCIQEDGGRQQWRLPYAAIRVDLSVRILCPPKSQAVVAVEALAIGDQVTYIDKYRCEHHGIVQRINHKTVLILRNGEPWLVTRGKLRKILPV